MRQRKTRPLLKPIREEEFEHDASPRKPLKPMYRNSPLVYLKAGPKKTRYQNRQVR